MMNSLIMTLINPHQHVSQVKRSPGNTVDVAPSAGVIEKLQLLSTLSLLHPLRNRKTSFCHREDQETSRWLILGRAVMSSREVKKNNIFFFLFYQEIH